MCDGASGASPTRALEPVRGPSLSDLLPPLPHETLPSPQHEDPLPPPGHDPLRRPVPESLPRDPLPSPAPELSPRDPPHLPSPVLDLEAPLSSLSTTTTTTMRRTCPRPRLYLPSACSPSPRRRRCRRPEWTRSAQFCYRRGAVSGEHRGSRSVTRRFSRRPRIRRGAAPPGEDVRLAECGGRGRRCPGSS